MFEDFHLARYRVTICAGKEGLSLPPYKGTAFRGAFGQVFRRIVCSTREKDCLACLLREQCPYAYIFETAPPQGAKALSKYESIPRPFVFEFPREIEDRNEIGDRNGEKLSFYLVLVGQARQYLPYFIIVLREMGETGIGRGRRPFNLADIEAVGLTKECSIYSPATNLVRSVDLSYSGAELLKNSSTDICRVRLHFETPIWLKDKGKLAVSPQFHIFFRQAMRRISALYYFHHGKALQADYAGLAERAQKIILAENKTFWQDWERYSHRQQQRIRIGGLAGSATYEGGLDEFLPWLKLGEHIHVGKNAVFGLGKYRVEVLG